MPTKRVLMIAYSFPPVGGAGVQRPLKFTKYLPQFGWLVTVLTVANPSVPVTDASLAKEVPDETLIVRARTLEPSYRTKKRTARQLEPGSNRFTALTRRLVNRVAQFALQPDPQILWAPAAVRQGLRVLRETPHDAIIATGPPFSSFLVAGELSRRSKLPLVLDYRDEWELAHAHLEERGGGTFTQWLQRRLQNRVLRRARAVVATTAASSRRLEAVAEHCGSSASLSTIYNGFDSDDFAAPPESRGTDRFRLVYTGTLWNLTDISCLVLAVERLAKVHPDLARKLELVIAGRRTTEQSQWLHRLDRLPVHVQRYEYLTHLEAIQLMQSADALCLTLADASGAERVVPAKTFEYMATQKPILALAPQGELRQILTPYHLAFVAHPRNVGAACDLLERLLRQPLAADTRMSAYASRFNRRDQACQLAALLNRVTAVEPSRNHERPTAETHLSTSLRARVIAGRHAAASARNPVIPRMR